MTSASIYGVVDYKHRLHTKEFNELYKKEQVKSDEQTQDKKTTKTPLGSVSNDAEKNIKDETAPVKTEKSTPVKKAKREFSIKEFSRAPLRDRDIKEPTSSEEK